MFPIGPYWSLFALLDPIGRPINTHKNAKQTHAHTQSHAAWLGGDISGQGPDWVVGGKGINKNIFYIYLSIMRLLELFSGTKSVGEVAETLGSEVTIWT